MYDNNLDDYDEWKIGDDNNKPVANFIPTVIETAAVKYTSGTQYRITLNLLFSRRRCITVTILDDDLETVNWSDVNFQCVVNTRNRKAKSYLATYIRLQY